MQEGEKVLVLNFSLYHIQMRIQNPIKNLRLGILGL